MSLTNLNAKIVACILFRKSRHKPNLESAFKHGFFPRFEHSRPQGLRSFWPAAGIESSGSNHFEITKEITEFCPSGLTQSSSMAHARNGCSFCYEVFCSKPTKLNIWKVYGSVGITSKKIKIVSKEIAYAILNLS